MTEVALPHRAGHTLALAGRLSSDEQLAQRASRGDTRAFGLLYERHHRALYGYCRSIVHNDEDAKDALQSAVMRALTALQASERDIAVRPWLFRIVHNEAISLLRRRGPGDCQLDGQEPAPGNVEQTVEDRERLATLVGDIQSLGERQRGTLLMRELCGLSFEEIAAALSTSPGAAKQALFEARCALHELTEGRAMACADVRRSISERDGRVLRGRKLRAHLRACAGCLQFRLSIEARGADLRMLVPPLPAVSTLGLLAHAFDIGVGHASEAAVVSGTTFGGTAAVSLVAKGLAGAAIMTAATAGTVELVRHPVQADAPTTPHHARRAVASPRLTAAPTVYNERSGPPDARPIEIRQVRHDVASTILSSARSAAPVKTPSPQTSLSSPAPAATVPATQPAAPSVAIGTETSPGTSSAPPGKRAAKEGPDSTPPGLAKSGGVPPGLAKYGKDPKPHGNPHADQPQGQGPATPSQPNSPGHSPEPHGNAPHSDPHAGHPGPPASHAQH